MDFVIYTVGTFPCRKIRLIYDIHTSKFTSLHGPYYFLIFNNYSDLISLILFIKLLFVLSTHTVCVIPRWP